LLKPWRPAGAQAAVVAVAAAGMKEGFFVGIMGVLSAMGLWHLAHIRNSGILKIRWVEAER
jgi:hypothetical protein